MILYNLRCHKDHVFETWFRDSEAYEAQAKAGVIDCPVCGSKKVEKAIMAPRVSKAAGRSRGRAAEPEATAVAASAGTPTGAAAGAGVTGATTKAMREAKQSAKLREALVELRRQVEANCDYVGPDFAEEARKIHYGETEQHNIYGEASDQEAKELNDEGIEFQRIPWPVKTDS